MVKGGFGMGKTLFIRTVLLKIQKVIDAQNISNKYRYNEKIEIFISSINAYTRNFRLNGFRPILQRMLKKYVIRKISANKLQHDTNNVSKRDSSTNNSIIDTSKNLLSNNHSNQEKLYQQPQPQNLNNELLTKYLFEMISLSEHDRITQDQVDKNDPSILNSV